MPIQVQKPSWVHLFYLFILFIKKKKQRKDNTGDSSTMAVQNGITK